jgi:hypothetical protein
VPVLTTPGNRPDGVVLPTMTPPQARELTGDKAYDVYDSKSKRSHLAALGVAPGCTPGGLDRDGLGSPGESGPRSKESSPRANSFTVLAAAATGAWPR